MQLNLENETFKITQIRRQMLKILYRQIDIIVKLTAKMGGTSPDLYQQKQNNISVPKFTKLSYSRALTCLLRR